MAASDSSSGLSSNSSPSVNSLSSTLLAAVMRRISLPKFVSASGSTSSIKIDEIRLDDATVDQVNAEDVKIELDTGNVVLRDVRTVVRLRITFNYGIHIPLPWPIPDFDLDGSTTVESWPIPFNVGNVDIPALNNVDLDIPSATLEDIEASLDPIKGLDLGSGTFKGVNLDDTVLPAAGFGLGGMSLGALNLNGVSVPSVSAARFSLDEFSPDAKLVFPSISIKNVELPSVSAPDVSSEGPVVVPEVTSSTQHIPLLRGILTASVDIDPTMDIIIGSMDIDNMSAVSSVKKIDIRDMRVSVGVSGVTLDGLELNSVEVESISTTG